MLATIPLPTATSLLSWSNRIYITGSFLTLASAALALYEQYSKSQGRLAHWKMRTQIFIIIAAFISFAGSVLAITFSNIVFHLKDQELSAYEKDADLRILQAESDAAIAGKAAALANGNTAQTNLENTKLRIQLATHETNEKKIDAELMAKNQQLATFTQGLAAQQQGMAQQMQIPPSLGEAQIKMIAESLKPFAGQAISIHMMGGDVRSQRLGDQFRQALTAAGIRIYGYSNDFGPNYVGVMILVKNPTPQPHPALADALRDAIQLVGIQPHTIADPSLKEGEVMLCIGPE